MNPIHILHLSDLHISDYNPKIMGPLHSLCQKLREVCQTNRKGFDLLILSGDLVHQGSGNYSPVGRFLKEIRDSVRIAADRVFLVPGNHDVVRNRCDKNIFPPIISLLKRQPKRIERLRPRQTRSFYPGFAAYLEFAKHFSLVRRNPVRLPGFAQADLKIADIRIRLCGINSALVAGPEDGPQPATKDRVAGIDHLRNMLSAEPTTLNIVVSHYPLSWIHKEEREPLRQILQQANAVLLTGHMHAPCAQGRSLTSQDQLLEFGVGAALGAKWQGNHHCRILELNPNHRRLNVHDLLWSEEVGWRSVEPLPIPWLRWQTICKPIPIPPPEPTRPDLMEKCRAAGLVKIENYRQERERTNYYLDVINQAAPDSEVVIVGRSLKDWLDIHQELKHAIDTKNLRLKLALLDEQTILPGGANRDDGPVGKIKSWIEQPIQEDWAMFDVTATMAKIREIRIAAKSKGSLEVYGLPFYVSHSFVAYTNRLDNFRYCSEEVGMALQPHGRPMIEVRRPANETSESCHKSYAAALEWMYRSMMTPERLVLSITGKEVTPHSTRKWSRFLAQRSEALGLVDLAVGRANLLWKQGGIDQYLEDVPEGGEVFMVGRSLVVWAQNKRYELLCNAVERKKLKCTFVIADPTLPCLHSLVQGDFAADDLRRMWPGFLEELNSRLPPNAKREGYLEIFGIPAYVPTTFASYTGSDDHGFCVLEPGIGVRENDRPVICFKEVDPRGNDMFAKLKHIYRLIPAGKKLLYSSRRKVNTTGLSGKPGGYAGSTDVVIGNALRDGGKGNARGWFVGPFLGSESGLRRALNVQVKWGKHPRNEERTVASKSDIERSLAILVAGEFRMTFPELRRRVELKKQGDYVLYGPGVMHTWKALQDCIVMTIRWPSECRSSLLRKLTQD